MFGPGLPPPPTARQVRSVERTAATRRRNAEKAFQSEIVALCKNSEGRGALALVVHIERLIIAACEAKLAGLDLISWKSQQTHNADDPLRHDLWFDGEKARDEAATLRQTIAVSRVRLATALRTQAIIRPRSGARRKSA